jgi:hypothetical protein
MQGSKRYGWVGHNRDFDWKKIRKRLRREFCFDSKRIDLIYDGGKEKIEILFDGGVILSTRFNNFNNLYRSRDDNYYSYHTFLKVIDDYFNVAKKDLIEYTVNETADPLALHVLLKCMDKRIGVRRLEKMYCDLVFEGLLDGTNVKPGIKILQSRIGTKEIKNV